MSRSIRRRYAPAAGAAAVVAVIAATVVAQEVGHQASPSGPAGSPRHAPSYLGHRDFQPTTSGGKVMIAP